MNIEVPKKSIIVWAGVKEGRLTHVSFDRETAGGIKSIKKERQWAKDSLNEAGVTDVLEIDFNKPNITLL
jgi:hypothetical protein